MSPINESCANFDKLLSNFDVNVTLSYYSENLNRFYLSFETFHTYASMTLCVFGLAANWFTVAVLTRTNMASVVNNFLIVIALCDSCLLLLCAIFVGHYKFQLDPCPAAPFTYGWTLFAATYANISVVLRAVSLWLTVVVAGYRKSVMASNLFHVDEKNTYVPIVVTATVLAVSLIAVPIFVGNAIREERAPLDPLCNNESVVFYRVVPSLLSYDHDCSLQKVNHFINAFLLKLLPCCFLTYYLVYIMKFMCHRENGRKNRQILLRTSHSTFSYGSSVTVYDAASKDVEKEEEANCCCYHLTSTPHPTTVILSAILLMTILCEMPNAVASAFSIILPNEFYWMVYMNLGDVFDILSLLNGLSTFLMYCLMSSSFRATLVDVFRGRIHEMATNDDDDENILDENGRELSKKCSDVKRITIDLHSLFRNSSSSTQDYLSDSQMNKTVESSFID